MPLIDFQMYPSLKSSTGSLRRRANHLERVHRGRSTFTWWSQSLGHLALGNQGASAALARREYMALPWKTWTILVIGDGTWWKLMDILWNPWWFMIIQDFARDGDFSFPCLSLVIFVPIEKPGRWRCCSTRFSEPWGQDPMIPFRWPKASKMFLRIPVTGQDGAADLFLDTGTPGTPTYYLEARESVHFFRFCVSVSGWGKMWTIQCWLSCNGTCGILWMGDVFAHLLGALTGSHSLPKHVWSNDQTALFQHSMFGSSKRDILSMKVSHSWRYGPDCIWNGWLIGMTIEAIATVWQRWLYSIVIKYDKIT